MSDVLAQSERNAIVAALPQQDAAVRAEHLRVEPLPLGRVLHEPGAPVDTVYFPLSGVVPIVANIDEENVVEVATVGTWTREEIIMDIAVRTARHGEMLVVSVSGEIDVYTAGSLREALTGVIAPDHADLIVDLTEVTFMDSTGLGVLIGSVKQVREFGGRVQLVVAEGKVVNIMRVTAVTQMFTVHETLEAALSAD